MSVYRDRLERMYHLQEVLQEQMSEKARFGQWHLHADDPERATALTKEIFICMVSELVEMLDWTNWKSWKRPDVNKPNVEELRVELVDLQHYLINLFMLWGVTPPMLLEMFEAKHRENVDRQQRGY